VKPECQSSKSLSAVGRAGRQMSNKFFMMGLSRTNHENKNRVGEALASPVGD
jgi:hypothetical protein